MRQFIGWTIIILGTIFSLYLGFWVMFVGGIVGLANAIRIGSYEGMVLAVNIAKIIFASTVVGIGIWLSCFIGFLCDNSENLYNTTSVFKKTK